MSRFPLRCWFPALLCVAGGLILFFAVAIGCAAALPYPDPTPKLLIQQDAELARIRRWAALGGGLLVVGGWQTARCAWRHRCNGPSPSPFP